jgi:hypothetical protein
MKLQEEKILKEARIEVNKIKRKKAAVIYTALFSDIDQVNSFLKTASTHSDRFDFILFTDKNKSELGSNNIVVVTIRDSLENPRLSAKLFKIMPHIFLSEYDRSLWIDASMLIEENSFLPFSLLNKYPLVTFEHSKRKYVYQEALECVLKGKDRWFVLVWQAVMYAKEGFLKQERLRQCGWLLRSHNNTSIIKLMEMWWLNINKYSIRDQVSLPYCIWKTGLEAGLLHCNTKDKYFSVVEHRSLLIENAGICAYVISMFWSVAFRIKKSRDE